MNLFPRSLIPFPLACFFVIALLPVCYMFAGSFWADGPTLKYYRSVFSARHVEMVLNSLLIGGGTTFFALLLGVPQGFLLRRISFVGKGFFGLLFFVPVLIPSYIHAIAWMHVFGKTGPLTILLHRVVHDGFAPLVLYNIPGTIYVLTLSYYPFATAIVMTGLKSMDYTMEEAALMHHPPWKAFQGVALPVLAPYILCGAVFIFVFSITNFGVPDLLRVRVYPTDVFMQFSAFYDEKSATALALPLVVTTVLLVLLARKFLGESPLVTVTGTSVNAPVVKLRKGGHAAVFLFFSLLFLLSTATPVGVLMVKTASWTVALRTIGDSLGEIAYTMISASAGAFIILLLAFPLCYLIARHIKGARILDYSSLVPLALPPTVLGIGLIQTWNGPYTQFLYSTSAIVVIAYTAQYIPFAMRILVSDLHRIDGELEESALLTSSSRWAVLRRITLPLCAQGLLTSLFISFVLCLGDLSATLLTIPPGHETLPIKIYNLMHYGAEHMVAALCLFQVFLVLALGLGFYLVYRRMGGM